MQIGTRLADEDVTVEVAVDGGRALDADEAVLLAAIHAKLFTHNIWSANCLLHQARVIWAPASGTDFDCKKVSRADIDLLHMS